MSVPDFIPIYPIVILEENKNVKWLVALDENPKYIPNFVSVRRIDVPQMSM